MDLKSGLKINSAQLSTSFVLKERLGSGTYGEVWRAFNTETQLYVAIKFMLPQPQNLEKSLHYFSREIEALKALGRHPNIPDYFGYDNLQGRLYFVMKYIEGPSLKDLGDANKILSIPFSLRYRYIQQLCNALAFVHSRNYVHSDIKPDNIKFDANIAYLIDFGIGFNESAEQTATEIGTPIYMHPKYARTRQGDIYGMVLVVYELLFGRHPIFTPSDIAVLNSLTVINETIQRLTNYRWQLPSQLDTRQFQEKWNNAELEALDRVFKKGLALDEKDAFSTIEAFSHSLAFLQQKASTTSPELPATAPTRNETELGVKPAKLLTSPELPATAPTRNETPLMNTTFFATPSVSETEIEELTRRRTEDDTLSRLRQSQRALPLLPSLAIVSFLAIIITLILILQGRQNGGDIDDTTPSSIEVVAEVTSEASEMVTQTIEPSPTKTSTPTLQIPTSTPSIRPSVITPTEVEMNLLVISPSPSYTPTASATFRFVQSLTPTPTFTLTVTPRPPASNPSQTATQTPTPTLSDDLNALFRIGQDYEDTKNYNCRQFNNIGQRLNEMNMAVLSASESEAILSLLADKDYQTIRDYCRERDSEAVPAGTQLESPNVEFMRSLRRYISQLAP